MLRPPSPTFRTPKVKPPILAKSGLRGVALVDHVIAETTRGATSLNISVPKPMPKAKLAKLTLEDGTPLPKTLKRWLAFDASWLGLSQLLGTTIPTQRLHNAASNVWPLFGNYFKPISDKYLPDQCLVLPGGDMSRRMIYVGQADERGEYPILYMDVDDNPAVGLQYPGFDVWLADTAGVLNFKLRHTGSLFDSPDYGPSMEQHVKRNLVGRRTYDTFHGPLGVPLDSGT